MSLILDTLRPAAPETAGGWDDLLADIAAQTQAGVDGFRLGTDVVAVAPRRGHGYHQTLTATLTHALYERFYHHHETPHLHRGPTDAADKRPASAREDPAFCHRLRAHLGERYYWEGGWRVIGPGDDDRTVVERDDLVLHVTDDEIEATADGALVRFPADRPWASTGYYVVTGTSGPMTRATGLARCYLHLLPETAPEVFARIVRGLDAAGLPFTAKVLNDPLAFGRPDSAVVYVAREQIRTVLEVVLAERRRDSTAFGSSVPAFTRRVLRGVAVADDPGPGTSFGQHRCCAVASGIVAAGPVAGPAERLAAVRRALTDEGLDLSALHLAPGRAEFDLADW